jgi:hypothetical protein
VEIFRCPTCIGVLTDAHATRCPNCRQSLRRKRPKVLGEDTRIGAANLPVDRWMLARLHNEGRRRHALPPVAWHGRFTTSPLAEPAFAATPSPVATPLAPPTTAEPAVSEPPSITPPPEEPPPATVGALALDVYTHPVMTPEPMTADVANVADDDDADGPAAPVAMWTPPAPAIPPMRPVVPHEDLDPDVRAIVDDLYEQARAELSGTDLAFFAPPEHGEHAEFVEPPTDTIQTAVEAPAPISLPQPAPEPPVARGGWVPAFTTEERRRRR